MLLLRQANSNFAEKTLTIKTAKFVKWSHKHWGGTEEATREHPSVDHELVLKFQKTHVWLT